LTISAKPCDSAAASSCCRAGRVASGKSSRSICLSTSGPSEWWNSRRCNGESGTSCARRHVRPTGRSPMSYDALREGLDHDTKAAPSTTGPRPGPFRGGGFTHRPLGPVAPIVFLIILLLWEVGSRAGAISPIALPAPSAALAALGDLFTSGMLWKHLGASLYRLVVGWTLGSLLGIVVGLMIGLFSLARAGLLPLVSALFPIPKIALLPLFIIWFGIGEGSKVATILFGTFF